MPHSNPSLLTRPMTVLLLATFCCLLWGSAYPAIKQGYALFGIARHDVASQMVFAGVLFVAAGGLLLLAGAVMGWGLRIKREYWGGVAALGLTQTALQYVFFYIGVANATGTKSSIMNATGTFFSVLLAHFIFHNDRLSGRRVWGCLVGFVGVAAAQEAVAAYESRRHDGLADGDRWCCAVGRRVGGRRTHVGIHAGFGGPDGLHGLAVRAGL